MDGQRHTEIAIETKGLVKRYSEEVLAIVKILIHKLV